MFRAVAFGLATLLPFGFVQGQQAPAGQPKATPKAAKAPPKKTDLVPLSDVVRAVELVIDAYNQRQDVISGTLPPLKTADFDFKTVVDIKGGPSVNFWIFKAGYSHEKQSTNDVTFEYVPQGFKPHGHLAIEPPPNLKDELTRAIEGAATQIKGEKDSDTSPLALKLNQLAITLAFQISNDYQGGLNIPIHMVTLGGTLDYNHADVQSVKLTFAFPEKPKDQTPD
jgi:hypothetical protein